MAGPAATSECPQANSSTSPARWRWSPAPAAVSAVDSCVRSLPTADAWRRRRELTAVGLALFLLPLLPVLTVPFLVTRYTYIPLAGFLMVAAAAAVAVVGLVPARGRRLTVMMVAAVAAAFLVRGLVTLRGDLEDAERRDEAHRRLLAEAAAFAPQLPRQGLILGVRLERESLNRDLLEEVRGVPKAYYERVRYPYGLVRRAPLFSYVLDGRGGPLYEECGVETGGRWAAVGHRSGGFVALAPEGGDSAVEAERWRQRGAFVEGFWPLPAQGSTAGGDHHGDSRSQ